MAGDIIVVENLKTSYGERVVHQGLNLSVRKGEILSIIGGSGTGKSTLLKVLLLLKEPDKGKVLFWGKDVFSLSSRERQELRDRMGVLFQSAALFSSMTVGENIVYTIRKKAKVSYKAACEMAAFKLELANLSSDVFHMYPSELSGGMKKKAGLARAMALDPEILFLDEPTSGLDPISADEFDRTISKVCRILGVTVVMITHDLPSLLISDRVAVLAKGKVVYEGEVKGLWQVDDPWLKKLLSTGRGRRFLGGVQA